MELFATTEIGAPHLTRAGLISVDPAPPADDDFAASSAHVACQERTPTGDLWNWQGEDAGSAAHILAPVGRGIQQRWPGGTG